MLACSHIVKRLINNNSSLFVCTISPLSPSHYYRHKVSHHFPDDIAKQAEELWAQTCPQLSTAIDVRHEIDNITNAHVSHHKQQRIGAFMKSTSTEKKFLQLEEMKRRAKDSDENVSVSVDPKDMCEDVVDSTMAEFITKYEEQLLKVLCFVLMYLGDVEEFELIRHGVMHLIQFYDIF